MDEKQGVPLRVFGLFSADVLPDALEHISGLCRRAGAAPGRHSALDVPAALALGLLWNPLFPGVAQFAFGFYSVMLTSTVLGLVTMVLFKPRSWCVYCPMGTMTQLICRGKHRGEAALHSRQKVVDIFPSVPYTIKYRSPTEVHMVG